MKMPCAGKTSHGIFISTWLMRRYSVMGRILVAS